MENLFTVTNISLLIAFCVVVLSAATFLFNYSKKRWKLKVEIRHTLDNSILISATNIGHEDVTFNIVGFTLPNGKLFWNPNGF